MSKMNKKAVIIIASVIVLLIIGASFTAFALTRNNGAAAVVNGVKIDSEKVEAEMTKAIAQYEAQGMELQEEQILELRSSVIDNLITREVLLQESESLTITPEEIEIQISNFRERFASEEEFNQALTEQGFDVETFKKVITEDLKIQKLVEKSIPAETIVSDEELTTFYKENPTYFTDPERVHASHILVTIEDKTTDEEKAQALLKIQRIEKELKNGADFAKLAIKESEGPSGPEGGDLGEFTKGQMIPAFEEIAFALPEGQISGIVETQFGYHIIKLHERFPESSVPFEEVKESIKSYLEQEKSQNKITDFIDELKAGAKIKISEFKTEK